jgi:hypothetical protein
MSYQADVLLSVVTHGSKTKQGISGKGKSFSLETRKLEQRSLFALIQDFIGFIVRQSKYFHSWQR